LEERVRKEKDLERGITMPKKVIRKKNQEQI